MARLTLYAVIAAGLLWGTEATAGPTLYLLVEGESCDLFTCPPPRPRIVEVDLTQGRIVREIPISAVSAGPSTLSVTADGRYVFWADRPSPSSGGLALRVLDVPTGYMSVSGTWNYETTFFSHPTVVRAFVKGFQNNVIVAEPYLQRTLAFPDCTEGELSGISGDGTRLLVGCAHTVPRALVANAESGAIVGVLPPLFGFEHSALNETGTEVFTVAPTTIPIMGTMTVRRLDVSTGAELASYTYAGYEGKTFFDRRTGRLFVLKLDEVLALDASTLNLLGRIATPGGQLRHAMVFEPNRPFAYVLHHEPPAPDSYVGIFDTDQLVPLGLVRIPYVQPTWGIAMAPDPPAPVNLSAAVAVSQVTLTWQLGPRSPAITHFEIEAGSTSGAANLARVQTGSATPTLVVDNVPPGQYYVRVRAHNYTGGSTPSSEILVTVP